MTPAKVALSAATLGAVLLSGCGVWGQRLLAPSPDYELYRQTEVAPTLEERLSAAWLYLKQYPSGAFRRDVHQWFREIEPQYFLQARASRARLRRYLEALPDGPHAAEARARVTELERAESAQARREEQALERARSVTDRLDAAEDARNAFMRAVADWVRWLTQIESWGLPTHELDHELIHAFRVVPPVATCGTTHCVKQVSMTYAIPAEGRLAERIAIFDVMLTLDAGAVVRAELSGPDLFSRVGEAAQRVPVAADDPQRRAEAIGAARQLVEGVLEERFPGAQCAGEAVAPVILERACHGVRVRLIASLDVGGEDRLVVEPTDLGQE